MDPSSSSYIEASVDGVAKEEFGMIMMSTISRAAIAGNVIIFNTPSVSDEHFLKKTPVENNNILHIAVRYERTEFVKIFLNRNFAMNKVLLTERNSQGDTPLHVAAEVGKRDIVELLCDYLKKSAEEGGHEGVEEKPWRAKNSQGNTALHLALLRSNYEVAEFMLNMDGGSLAGLVNGSLEAPLHLAITHLYKHPRFLHMTRFLLLEKASCVASWRDEKGFTPLHRAASLLDDPFLILQVTQNFIDLCPESTLMCDPFGKSFLHLLIHNNKIFDGHRKNLFDIDYLRIEDLICLNEISIYKNHQDQDGNTPLHIALKCGNIHMAGCLLSKCSADPHITNKDGISAWSMIQQRNLWHQLYVPRAMTREESSSANKKNINFLRNSMNDFIRTTGVEFYGSQYERERTTVVEFYGSQNDDGSNFLHLLMSETTEHYYLSSSDGCHKFFEFIQSALISFPELVCQTDQKENTPLHILAQNKDLCKTLADPELADPSLLSKSLSDCAKTITYIKSRRTTTNEYDNHDQLPWVMRNKDGNTPLHEAIRANNKVLVLQLLRYSQESATIVNNHKETPLHLLAATENGMEEFTIEEIMEMVKADSKALELQDKNGHIPMKRAIEVKNVHVVVTLLCKFQDFSKKNDNTFWQTFCIMADQSNNFLKELFQKETFQKMLGRKYEKGNTLLHIAIQQKCFAFVRELLDTLGSELVLSEDNQWLMNLLKISNNDGETSEDLLADLPTISKELEERLLTDRKMRGIRSSWGIPRTQFQNYMSSMNVIAALQTTITFTAAFTVPGGLNQDIGTPILIRSIAFQIFMIIDVIAMCLSMMVLICLLWMVATNKRKSVLIQDFSLTLLRISFVATLLTFMAGVYATIYPTKPWIVITTLVLCSLVMLFLARRVLTNLLLHFKYPEVRC